MFSQEVSLVAMLSLVSETKNKYMKDYDGNIVSSCLTHWM